MCLMLYGMIRKDSWKHPLEPRDPSHELDEDKPQKPVRPE
jgi:hypothetical protein